MQTPTDEQQRQNAVAKIWLNYFNYDLLETGMIPLVQHCKMYQHISTRKPTAME